MDGSSAGVHSCIRCPYSSERIYKFQFSTKLLIAAFADSQVLQSSWLNTNKRQIALQTTPFDGNDINDECIASCNILTAET